MTISREIRAGLVIISAICAAHGRAVAEDLAANQILTTSTVAPAAAALTTVVITGSIAPNAGHASESSFMAPDRSFVGE